MQEVGILYICTGKYSIFWKDFYKSCEKYFLPGYKKHYFVFTDAKEIYGDESPYVHKVFEENRPFPMGTLMRYEMFNKAKDQLSKMDYLYFYNANIIIQKEIKGEEIFPSDEESGLIGYLHSGFYNKKPAEFIYERNPLSKACIAVGDGSYYYQGCFIGGKSKEFLAMIAVLDKTVKEDLANNFIAIWWDESHLNHYLKDKKVKILHPGYAYPELAKLPFEKKAIMLDKSRHGGLALLRGTGKPTLRGRVKFLMKRILGR